MKTSIASANQNGSITPLPDYCNPYIREAMVIPIIMNSVSVLRKKPIIALELDGLWFLESWAFKVSQGEIKIRIATSNAIM